MISVCIPTYNGEKYIKAQLDSIIPQLGAADEIIISDDGSTDKTIEIINGYHDDRIKMFVYERTRKSNFFSFYKITQNIENALNHAAGDFIFLADQDDVWTNDKIVVALSKIGDNLCLLHDCTITDEGGRELMSSYFRQNNSKLGIAANLMNCSYLGCCMVFRKELLKTALPFPAIPVPHDIWLGLLAEYSGRIKMIDNRLLHYRRHASNQSTSGEKSGTGFIYRVCYRFNIVRALLLRILKKIFCP
jgi:glycosyltransferase involved in cell wall biosynthesis